MSVKDRTTKVRCGTGSLKREALLKVFGHDSDVDARSCMPLNRSRHGFSPTVVPSKTHAPATKLKPSSHLTARISATPKTLSELLFGFHGGFLILTQT